jgi:hypothetical protein
MPRKKGRYPQISAVVVVGEVLYYQQSGRPAAKTKLAVDYRTCFKANPWRDTHISGKFRRGLAAHQAWQLHGAMWGARGLQRRDSAAGN